MLVRIADTVLHTSFYILLFIVPFLFYPANSELFEFNKMLATYALAVIIAGAWAIKSVLAGKIIFRRTFLDIPLLLFLVSQIASTYFSIDPHTSFWGYYSRSHGGLLSTIAYLTLTWAFVSNMGAGQVKTAIKYLLSGAFLISIWGILEHFGASPSCYFLKEKFNVDCWVQDVQTRVFATLGQPNWLAAWLVAIIPLTWALLEYKSMRVKERESKLKLTLFYSFTLLLFLALLFTKSRSGLLGFGAAFAVFWLLYFPTIIRTSKFIIQIFRPFSLLVTSYLLLVTIFGTSWTPSVSQWLTKQKAESIKTETGTVLETGGTESGEIRKIVWKGAIDIWRTYPIFGSGVETFAYSYYQFRPVEHNTTSEWDFLYNKAHNEYLNFAATTGTFGLGAYLILVGAVLVFFARTTWEIRGGKLDNEVGSVRKLFNLTPQYPASHFTLHISLLAGYVSILVTNFFGFSVVNVATLFFLFPAMAIVLEHRTQNTEQRGYQRLTIRQSILMTFVLIAMFYVLSRMAGLWQADTLYAKAEKFKIDMPYSSIRYAKQALELRPDEPLYYDKLAQATSYFAIEAEEENQHEAALSSARVSDEASLYATTISPYNLSLLKSRATILTRLVTVNPKYLNDSLLVRERAVSLAPTDPKVHYDLGVLYSRLGQNEQARKMFEKAVILKPDYEDAKNALKTINEL